MKNKFINIIFKGYHKIEVKTRPFFSKYRRKRLQNTDFTIVSNNCWGGILYEYYGIKKLSPTVGCYFYADDYIKFISNLSYYLSIEIKMITSNQSKHKESLFEKGETKVPVGVLDDVEVVFLHYSDADLAKDKWTKRISRVNWENIIYKFSYMNECTDKNIEDFLQITNGKKRVCFVNKNKWNNYGVYEIPAGPNGQILDDTTWFNKYVDTEKLINDCSLSNSSRVP